MQHTTHIMPRDASPILIRRIGATQSGAGGGAVVAAAHGDERTLSVRSSTCCLRCNCCECDWATAPPAREPVAYRSYDRHSRPTDRPGIPASHQSQIRNCTNLVFSSRARGAAVSATHRGNFYHFTPNRFTFTVLLNTQKQQYFIGVLRVRERGREGRKNRPKSPNGPRISKFRTSKRRVLLNAAEKIETAVECLSHRCSRWRLLPRTLPTKRLTKRFLDAPCLVIESGLQRWLPNAAVHVRAHAVGGIVSILLEH